MDNSDSQILFGQANETERSYIEAFWEEKKRNIDLEVVEYEENYEVFDSFGTYKKVCQQSGESNSEKLNLLITFKQIFSVPWLLCSEQLLSVTYKGQL